MFKIQTLLILCLIHQIYLDCGAWNEQYGCDGNNIKEEYNFFQTPPRSDTDENYKSTYQDMHYLVGYSQLKYNEDKTSCTVNIITFINNQKLQEKLGTNYKLQYKFGNIIKDDNSYTFNIDDSDTPKNGLYISVEIIDQTDGSVFAKLEFEEEYFIWDNPTIVKDNEGVYQNGQKGAIVELFGWPYEDIAQECEFLKVAGYLGVKIIPPNESILNNDFFEDGELNPWWYYFQTVSYKLQSRMGNKKQLKNMIDICRRNGIRIYSELAINQMVTNGFDEYKVHQDSSNCDIKWGPRSGSAGSPFWTTKGRTENNDYSGTFPVFEFPSVPYFSSHFHCYQKIDDWTNTDQLDKNTNDELIDVNTDNEYVQQRIADFFTELLSIGISGFIINSGKHISPSSFATIFGKLKENLGGNDFPDDFFISLEMTLGNEHNILICSNDGDYNYADPFITKLGNKGLSENDISKIKILIEDKIYTSNYCNGDSPIQKNKHIIFLENQNNQKVNAGGDYITNSNKDTHKNNYKSMMNNSDYNLKIVFSSYILINGACGFPDGHSDCSSTNDNSCTKSVPYVKAYAPLSIGYDEFIEGNYTRIHRDIDIVNAMRDWLNLGQLTDEQLYGNERLKAQYFYNPTTVPTNSPDTIEPSNAPISDSIEFTYSTFLSEEIESSIISSAPETDKLSTSLMNEVKTDELTSLLNDAETILVSNECDKKCLTCDEESKKLNLCITCNTTKGNYYPVNFNNGFQKYYECFLKDSNPERFYFDNDNNEFKPCYETCLTCNQGGDAKIHNCAKCENNYRFRPDNSPPNNCVANCTFYYISPFGQYKCLDILQCPEEAKLLIKEKNICIDDCSNDDTYKVQYNGKCLENCPENTILENNICVVDVNRCTLTQSGFESDDDDTDLGFVETLAKTYSNEFTYTDNHISQFNNGKYNIIIYKNDKCIKELSLKMPTVDFGDCYNKVKDKYHISENLIIAEVDKINEGSNPITFYSFFNPKTGDKLDVNEICTHVTVEENLLSLLNENHTNYELMIKLTKQGINIFNISHEFYTDICFEFESPINKDIPLQDRILAFYPNATLCDPGCENEGINFEDMSAKCKCKFNDLANNNLLKENVLISSFVDEALEFINSSNIAVLKCYKYFFKYFFKRFGSYITLTLILIHIIFSIIFCCSDLMKIKRYIYELTQNYVSYISISGNNNININEPPSKKSKSNQKIKSEKNVKEKSKNEKNSKKSKNNAVIHLNTSNNKKNNEKKSKNNKLVLNHNSNSKSSSKDSLVSYGLKKYAFKTDTTKQTLEKITQSELLKFSNNKNKNKYSQNEEYFNEYLATSIEDMEYDDAIKKDNRQFCEFFYETLQDKQIIAYTFFAKDPLKPRSIKIILFVLNIILYFVVNGLFFSEDYASEVYHLEEEETFFSFVPRSISRFVYTTMVSLIIGFIVDCFFTEEKKIKGIFMREKENLYNLKGEIVIVIKEIESRYYGFIFFVLFILIISLYYLICFNYVYPHMQMEWLKSSIIIFIILQILSILTCLLETILRFLSFHYKSERIYKISKLVN